MINFPAMTEEQRQVLIGRLQIYIRTAETAIKAGLATKEDVFNLNVRKIALAALTAEPVTYAIQDENERKEGYMTEFSSSGIAGYVSPEKYGLTELALYTAPPAPVLRLPDEADSSNLPFAAMAWNACLAEVKRLNTQTAPPEASNEQ